MKTQPCVLLAAMLAGAVVASPTPAISRRTGKLSRKPYSPSKYGRYFVRQTSTETSPNWGGIITSGSSITAVQASFTVPDVSLASGDSSSSTWSGSAWVGIDGTGACGSNGGLWQSGVAWEYDNGWSYYSWYEWFPGPPIPLNVDVAPGDNIYVQVDATSSTSGTYYLINNSNGQSTSGQVSSNYTLCQQNAEWIVENNSGASDDGEGTVMPDFGSVQFTNALYKAGGTVYGVSDGVETVVDDDNVQYTECSVLGDSEINCSWTSSS